MEIKKQFTDIGSIIKSLLRHIDLNKVYIKIGYPEPNAAEVCVGLFKHGEPWPVVYYKWSPGAVQSLNVPDDICMPHVLTKKVRVKSPFNPRFSKGNIHL